KHIVVVCNLKPAKLVGIESKGMLLAADTKPSPTVLTADKSKPGDKVFVEGLDTKPKKMVTIEEFAKLDLHTDEKGYIFLGNRQLKTENEDIIAPGVNKKFKVR
ncbi:hypothetical protein KY320_00705, partial [Candidatus Woesearchaeota archaeon]|nr:hypothetical protein [Candidatus Woesearchaeota archaeon]